MFFNTHTSVLFLYLSLLTLIRLTFGDVHTAFDVSPDVNNGGCEASQINSIELAFTEVMQMVTLIQNGITSLQAGTDTPAVGWMFEVLFGIQATEDLTDNELTRPQDQIDALSKMSNLMKKIVDHSTGAFQIPTSNHVTRKTRIFCSQKWLKATYQRIIQATGLYEDPPFFLPNNHAPGELFWYDIQSNLYTLPQADVMNPDQLICGSENEAITQYESNAITFCPLNWKHQLPPTTAGILPPLVGLDPIPDLISDFMTWSSTFFHEYTHLAGDSEFGTQQDPIPDVRYHPEAYGFAEASDLNGESGTDIALQNADSYALLGIALKFDKCDWRDGGCRSPAYWAGLRRQQQEAKIAAAMII